MRVFAVSNSQKRIAVLLVAIILFPFHISNAQISSRPKIAQASDIFIIEENGKSYTCGLIGDKWLSGTLKSGNNFITDKARIKALKSSISRASEPALSRLKNKLTKQKRKLKVGQRLCQDGPPTPPATPTPTPTPIPLNPLRPLSRSMTAADIQHLFRRAALGYVSPENMSLGLNYGAPALVNNLFRVRNDAAAEQTARSWLSAGNPDGITRATGIKYYALIKLILTQNPLLNHLCMIHLHDIIPVSIVVVDRNAAERELMLRYFDTLCGIADNKNYRELIKEITIDPAMLIWLDGATNNKLSPNENYARELLELFTVGVFNQNGTSNYSDLDVATAARALTGLGVITTPNFGISTIFNYSAFDSATNKLMFRSTQHAGTVYDWESLVDFIFDHHPNTAYNIALMLAERYVHPDISQTNPAYVLALANHLKINNYDLISTLATLLLSEEFYNAANKNSILRSPAELTIQLFRMLKSTGIPVGTSPFSPANILNIAAFGGHTLAEPPTVFGWDRDKEFTIGSRHLSLANQLTNILSSGTFSTEENATGWNYKKLYPPNNLNPTAVQMVDHLLNLMAITVNANQKELLVRYLNTQRRQINNNGQTTIEDAEDPWNPASYAQARRKLVGLLRIMLSLREYRVY